MIRITTSGSTEHMDKFLADALRSTQSIESRVRSIADAGVHALMAATPKESGETASAWGYEIERTKDGVSINWTNSHVNKGEVVAVLIQYGHATGTGGYVQGYDYINPALKPIFDQIANEAWKAVNAK